MKKNIQFILLFIMSSLILLGAPDKKASTSHPDSLSTPKIFIWLPETIDGVQVAVSKGEATLRQALSSQNYLVISLNQLSESISTKGLNRAHTKGKYRKISKSLLPFADFAIVGTLSSETYSTGTLNYARASAQLDIVELQTGKVLTSAKQSNIKAAGNTEVKANISALRKCAYAVITDIMQNLETTLN